MQKVTFIAEKGNADSNGSRILLGGIKFKNPVPIHLNFNSEEKIGEGVIEITQEAVMVSSSIDEKYLNLYPAIGVEFKKDDFNKDKEIVSCNLYEVSLNGTPNADPSIKPIGE